MLFHTVNFWKCMCVRDFVAQLNVSHSRSEWDRVFFSNEPMLFDQKKGRISVSSEWYDYCSYDQDMVRSRMLLQTLARCVERLREHADARYPRGHVAEKSCYLIISEFLFVRDRTTDPQAACAIKRTEPPSAPSASYIFRRPASPIELRLGVSS